MQSLDTFYIGAILVFTDIFVTILVALTLVALMILTYVKVRVAVIVTARMTVVTTSSIILIVSINILSLTIIPNISIEPLVTHPIISYPIKLYLSVEIMTVRAIDSPCMSVIRLHRLHAHLAQLVYIEVVPWQSCELLADVLAVGFYAVVSVGVQVKIIAVVIICVCVNWMGVGVEIVQLIPMRVVQLLPFDH